MRDDVAIALLLAAADKFARVQRQDPGQGRGALYEIVQKVPAVLPPDTPSPIERFYRALHALCGHAAISTEAADMTADELVQIIRRLAGVLRALQPEAARVPYYLRNEL